MYSVFLSVFPQAQIMIKHPLAVPKSTWLFIPVMWWMDDVISFNLTRESHTVIFRHLRSIIQSIKKILVFTLFYPASWTKLFGISIFGIGISFYEHSERHTVDYCAFMPIQPWYESIIPLHIRERGCNSDAGIEREKGD